MADRGRAKKILALDWDAHTLRVVHAALEKRGLTVDRLLSVAIPSDVDPDSPEQMGRHIRRVLDQEGIATRHALVDIPRDQAILNTLSLPAAAPDELPGMVEIQIAKELPFPVSEAAVDFAVEQVPDDAVTADVLVAAIRREVLEQYVATFAAAGLKLDRVGLRPYANKVAACALLKHAMPDRVLFLDVRPSLTEINVLRNGALAFSRAASVVVPTADDRGGSTPSSSFDSSSSDHPDGINIVDAAGLAAGSDAAIRSLVVEVTRSIEAYRADDAGATIDHVVIGGDVGIEEALAEAIEQRLDISTEIYNPASTFGWEPDEGAAASAFAASLGLVLGHADTGLLHFDFLHPKKTVSATQQRLRKAPLIAAVVALFILAGGAALYNYTKPDRDKLAEIETRIEELEGKVRENKKFLRLVEEIREFDEQHVWVDTLDDILALLPSNEELVITRMDMNQKDQRVVLKTQAKQRDTAEGVLRDLEAFRRLDRDPARFKVSMGAQSEKKGQLYPYVQDLKINILNDDDPKGGRADRSSRGSRG